MTAESFAEFFTHESGVSVGLLRRKMEVGRCRPAELDCSRLVGLVDRKGVWLAVRFLIDVILDLRREAQEPKRNSRALVCGLIAGTWIATASIVVWRLATVWSS